MANYYRFKEKNPKFFKNVRPLELDFIGDDDILSIPPYREQTGRRLMLYRIGMYSYVCVLKNNKFHYCLTELFARLLSIIIVSNALLHIQSVDSTYRTFVALKKFPRNRSSH